jgi:cyclopropane-fatty-acyl-phospholipid synthase
VRFLLQDYREHEDRYDRIVSVGMFEHVGHQEYRAFFAKLRELMSPGGIALLHTIGSSQIPQPTNPWIRKHIFPGGYIPSLSEVSAAAESAPLLVSDVEVLRLHYAFTLAEWLKRFRASRAEVLQRMGKRFYRMWEFYLASSEASFRTGGNVVFQIQLTLENDSVPLVRDYLYPSA